MGHRFHQAVAESMDRGRHRTSCLVLSIGFVFVLMSDTVAQEPPMSITLADSIVITATRAAFDARLIGRRVAVWSAEDIKRMPVSSVDELLRMVSGVEVQSRGGFGVQSDITIRGSTFNGVLVLLDGARLNDPMTGHFLADIPVPLSEVARIEVLRGPASALYGPDALGGVIHIMTFGGLAARTSDPIPGTFSGELVYGSYGTAGVQAHILHQRSDGGVGASGHWMRSDGMPIKDDHGNPIISSVGPVGTDFERHTYSVFGVFELADQRMYLRAGLDTRDFGAFQFYTPFASDTAREATSTYWLQASAGGNLAASALWQANLAAKQHEDRYVYNPITRPNEHTSRMLTGDWQVTHQPTAAFALTSGLTGELRSIESNNLGEHMDGSAGVFAMAFLQPAPAVSITGGIRLNYDPAYGLEPTPQMSAAYNAGMFTLRSAVGRAVRAPNYVERYINRMLARPAGGNLGNPDLKPERAWSGEAGLDFTPRPNITLHATGFERRTSDLIDFALLAPTDTVFLARNILTVTTRGMEMEANARHYYSEGAAQLHVSYTFLDAEIGSLEPGVQYKYALTNARHQAQVSSSAAYRGLSMSLQAIHRKPLESLAYTTVNIRIRQRIGGGSLPVSASAEVRNIFDVARSEIFGAPLPRRWVLFGIRAGR